MDLNVLEDMRDSLSEMRRQRDELASLLREVLDDKYTDFRQSLAVKCRAALEKIK